MSDIVVLVDSKSPTVHSDSPVTDPGSVVNVSNLKVP